MPRRSILSAAERDSLLTVPNAKEELALHTQRIRLIHHPPASWACEPARLRGAALLYALPRRDAGHRR